MFYMKSWKYTFLLSNILNSFPNEFEFFVHQINESNSSWIQFNQIMKNESENSAKVLKLCLVYTMGQYVFCSIDVLMCSRFVILQAKHVLLITQQYCWSYTLSFLHVGLQKMFIIDMKKDRALAFYRNNNY